jgi:hypothetical protein
MAFQTYEITLLSIGLLPVVIAILAGLFLAGVYLLSKITREDQKFIGKSFAVVAGIVFIVMVFIGTVCMNIRPTEQFEDMHSVDPTETESQKLLAEEQTSIKALLSGIGAAELATCKLITRVDNFIKGDVGKPGLDDPTLVTQAQQKARDIAGGPIQTCPPEDSADIDIVSSINDADNRMARLENTLNSFTGPKLKATYNKTVPCAGAEGFVDAVGAGEPTPLDKIKALQKRLEVVQSIITNQQTQYLKPIDDKTAALQRGEVSDCDKGRGMKTGIKSATATAPSPGAGAASTGTLPPKATPSKSG